MTDLERDTLRAQGYKQGVQEFLAYLIEQELIDESDGRGLSHHFLDVLMDDRLRLARNIAWGTALLEDARRNPTTPQDRIHAMVHHLLELRKEYYDLTHGGPNDGV